MASWKSLWSRRSPGCMSRALAVVGLLAFVMLGATPVRAERAALPANLVALDSPEGERLLLEAKAREDFFHLVTTYVAQEQPSFCGVASSVMILNALPIASPPAEPGALFNQTNFFNEAGNRVRPREDVLRGGMTLETIADLLRTHPTEVKAVYASDTTLEAFRDLAAKNLAKADDYIIVNYQRSELGQETTGHFSPLGAYDEKTDRFLLMDVARYKYPPVWVEAATLFKAMSTLDLDSGKSRGFVVVSPSATAAPPGPPKPAKSRMFQILAGLLGFSFLLGGGVGFGIGTWRARRKAKAAG